MTTQTQADTATEAAIAYLRDHADEHLAQLDEFLRIQSVSADPQRDAETRRAAEWIAAELTRIGIDNAQIHETNIHPVVTGEWTGAGADAPSVLVYCHYDVQPEDPIDEWASPPFEARHEDDRIYARGSGDDKGQLFMHLKAAEAWLATAGRLPLNLRFIFEGDEEHDSTAVEGFIAAHPELLRADICVVSDGDTFDDKGTPSIGYGLRGIAYFEVHVRGPFQDLHSGGFGGGVDNPANVLVRMLASMTDDDGRVTVPGFYDRVRELTDEEHAAYAALPFDEGEWRDSIKVPAAGKGERAYPLIERLSARPTFDINGLWGGYSGEGSKTIIPAVASAKFSMRLVPDQDYHEIERLVVEHLENIAPPSVSVDVRVIHGGAPAITPLDTPVVEVAAQALETAFGAAPLFTRSGGSIPFVAALDKEIGLKTVMVGFANPSGNFHAPNEWIAMLNYTKGLEALVRMWGLLGTQPASRIRA